MPRIRFSMLRAIRSVVLSSLVSALVHFGVAADEPSSDFWPEATATNKPWTRWWWHGSAVTEAEITRELESFAAVGFGGVEITPIYGVVGEEARETEFLSERWLALIKHACLEAKRLGLLVDIVPGTGWRLGREDIPESERAVELKLTKTPGADGSVVYHAEAEPSGERVKRPAPGGSGYTIDMLDRDAVTHYFEDFEKRFFNAVPPGLVRAQFHDSWEYDTNWTRDFLAEFQNRRGYDLTPYLAALDEDGKIDRETAERVRYDYRTTIEELIFDHFARNWGQRSHALGLLTRNQAHGTVGNILDVYAQTDIPETEIFRDKASPLVQKFASSAGHVAGKPLISAESFTWLSDHWLSDLGKIRQFADYLFICGINHIFYHGTAYSPSDAAWPGWVFYASTQVNDRNPLWRHLPALNEYITRSQSYLQRGTPSSDILLYWPISDLYSERPGTVFKFHIDGDKWTAGAPLHEAARALWKAGYQFDYVSDRQLETMQLDKEGITHSGVHYKAIVIPSLSRMPETTAAALADLAKSGARIVSLSDSKSWDVPGMAQREQRRARLAASADAIASGSGYLETPELFDGLAKSGVHPESVVGQSGLACQRRVLEDGSFVYFIVNDSDEPFNGAVELLHPGASAVVADAWTGTVGVLAPDANGAYPLRLAPHSSVILNTRSQTSETASRWSNFSADANHAIKLDGPWQVELVEGGPTLPKIPDLATLDWLNELDVPGLEDFSGIVRYQTRFDAPPDAAQRDWALDIEAVGSSAVVWLNGTKLGTIIQAPYQVRIPQAALKPGENDLTIEVATLAANRIRYLDRNKIVWRIFKDINFVNINYRPFDASDWPTTNTGLKGPVTLIPLQ